MENNQTFLIGFLVRELINKEWVDKISYLPILYLSILIHIFHIKYLTGAPGRNRTYAPASGGQRSIH